MTEIPTVGKAKVWERSGLIEEVVCYDQSVLQTSEFDRDKEGELERYEVIRRKDIAAFIGERQDELLLDLHDCPNCANNLDMHLRNSSATCEKHEELAARARALNGLLNRIEKTEENQ